MLTQHERLSASQLARAVGLSTSRIRQLAVRGEIPFTETPLGRLFDPICVERIREMRRKSEAARRRVH